MHAISEFFRLGEVRQFRLHPDHITEWRICDRTVDCTLAATLVSVVALSCPRSLPVEVHVNASKALCNGSCLGVALAPTLLQKLFDEALLIDVHSSVYSVGHGLVVELHLSFLGPCVFDGLQLITILSCLFCRVHQLTKWLECWVGATHDVVMVAGIDSRGDQGSGF
jgi:hypothetical protein